MLTLSSYDVEPEPMDEIQQQEARQVFRQALAEVAERARQALPQANGRIDGAVQLILRGDVSLAMDGKSAQVASSSEPGKAYTVDGTCPCPDYAKAPEHFCRHRLAYGLLRRASALTRERVKTTHQNAPGATNGTEDDPTGAP